MNFDLILKVVNDRTKIERLIELLGPAMDALKPALPEIISIGKELAADLMPDYGNQLAQSQPLLTLDTKWLQTSLNKLGAKLLVDGDNGAATRAAVSTFQVNNGLPVTGWASQTTCMAIVAATYDGKGIKK
jgi:hypothetical protein